MSIYPMPRFAHTYPAIACAWPYHQMQAMLVLSPISLLSRSSNSHHLLLWPIKTQLKMTQIGSPHMLEWCGQVWHQTARTGFWWDRRDNQGLLKMAVICPTCQFYDWWWWLCTYAVTTFKTGIVFLEPLLEKYWQMQQQLLQLLP